MLNPGGFAKFTGFSENEVKRLCRKHKMVYEDVKAWYDGYELSGTTSIYKINYSEETGKHTCEIEKG